MLTGDTGRQAVVFTSDGTNARVSARTSDDGPIEPIFDSQGIPGDDRNRMSEAYCALFTESPVPKLMFDAGTFRFLAVNEAALSLYGYSRDEFLSLSLPDLHGSFAATGPALTREGAWSDAESHVRKDGTRVSVEVTSRPIRFIGVPAQLAVIKDVTERQRLQEQLCQSQKMEAIGRLAGGVAHDFNNILSVILTYAEFRLANVGDEDPAKPDLEEIIRAGQRASDVARQLLMFSRRKAPAPKALVLDDVLSGVTSMLRRVVGEDVQLLTVPGAPQGKVLADEGRIEQVLMNLVVNARDAMPDGGKLTIETKNVELDEDYASDHFGVTPGPYVMLAVSDTGIGMDKETQAKIFEPFFTTKEPGKGTGLGLSTVFGIVKQCGGHVWVYSEPDRGTTFRIYLPRTDGTAYARSVSTVAPGPHRGTETVLLVEDDDQVRVAARGILRRNGYHVLEASNGGEAFLICEQHEGRIHLLLTDVVLPRMGGRQLAERLSDLRPDMRVLFMSGYTDEAILHQGVLESGSAFIQKPLTPDALSRKVRSVLRGVRPVTGTA